MINKNDVKEKDLRRIRNLYEGKLNVKTNIQVGFEEKKEEHKEGDIWVENNKKWTIRNGIKQTISNLDTIKKDVIIPFTCPSCNKAMKKRLDKKYYKIHKRCMDCVIEAEAEIRNKGLWEIYEKNIMKSNILDALQDFKFELYDVIDSSNQSYVTEHGEVENWVGGVNKEETKKQVDMYIETIKEKLSNES
jgi:transcription elongation factor Elf1